MSSEKSENRKDDFKLEPLTNDQHAVSAVPKTTTEFPFFYLTKHKERLSKPIVYEGIDAEGRPIRWAANPNSSIGSPGIDAHETWTRLIKPTWEAYRTPDDRLPNILPLGGMRQCLRVVGWGEGGWEARRLLRALNQIGATWITADFWVPTGKTSDDGKPTYRSIKGGFSRLTIYAVGDKHVTDEELKDGKFTFNFDLEDTLYIQFHPLEVAIQESQPQRYLDNQYMFSVGPAARRWYELMAAKIFGVVKNGGDHCDILYSWYVKHHHTLNRQATRRRVVQQINEIVREHISSSFIKKVDYRPIKESGKEIDFLIRFFPGAAAKESIARVISSINKKRTLPAGEPRTVTHRQKRKTSPLEQTAANKRESLDRLLVAEPAELVVQTTQASVADPESKLIDELSARGVMPSAAIQLMKSIPAERLDGVGDYIEYFDVARRGNENLGTGFLYKLIRDGSPLPANFETQRQREDCRKENERLTKLSRYHDLMKSRYAEYCKRTVDQSLAEVPVQEFDQRVARYKAEFLQQATFWSDKPELADQMARRAIIAQIQEGTSLQLYEDFSQQNSSAVLSDLGLDPIDIGLDIVAESLPGDLQALQNALQSPTEDEQIKEAVLSSEVVDSLPEAI